MTALFLQGNSRDVLKNLPADYVHCAVTSPPYFGLRQYLGGEEIWDGDESCEHIWLDSSTPGNGGVGDYEVGRVGNAKVRTASHESRKLDICSKCGAWKGQLGAEPTPELFIRHLIQIMREVRRVLRPDGVFFINIGDSWAGGKGQSGGANPDYQASRNQSGVSINRECDQLTGQGKTRVLDDRRMLRANGIKPLDMVLIPEQLALATRADGWYVRSVLIWAKGVSLSDEYNGNPMPECLDPSTKVFVRTPDGWMRRVSLDDVAKMGEPYPEILSPSGWGKINRLWETDKSAMTLQVGKVERVICSPDHRFPISHDRRRLSTELKEASNIRFVGYSDYLLYKPIQQFCESKVSNWGKFNLNYDVGFVLGIYVAEGSCDNRFGSGIQISLGGHELKLRDKIAGILSTSGIGIHPEKGAGRECVFIFYDESFFRLVDAFVQGQAKTKRLTIDLLLNTSEKFRQGVLDGYLAGDGYERPAGGWSAASASVRLRDDVSTLASSLGIITSKGQQRSVSDIAPRLSVGHTLWTPYVNRGEKAGTDGVFCIPVRGRGATRQGSNTKRMIDIEVDGGVFLIGDGLITHNSVNGWRWERHKVKVGDNGRGKEAWRQGANATPQQDHDKSGNFQNSAVWRDCPGCPKCEKNGGYILRKGSWRPTDSYEHILMLTKTNHYFCDREAVLERGVYPAGESRAGGDGHKSLGAGSRTTEGLRNKDWNGNGGRNLRSVLMIPTIGYKGAHFAVYNPKLIEPLIKAATSEKGCCPKCGSPYARVLDKGDRLHIPRYPSDGRVRNSKMLVEPSWQSFNTIGWLPTCECGIQETEPCRVLDPFSGAGTTSLVCKRLGLDSIGIDTSAEYIRLAEARIVEDEQKRIDDQIKQLRREAKIKE